jgi:GAF domain-containing protein
MEPIPQTVEVVEELGPFGASGVLRLLEQNSAEVQHLVPDCVGLSLSLTDDDVALTLVASGSQSAAITGTQDAVDGPGAEPVRADEEIDPHTTGVPDEQSGLELPPGMPTGDIASTLSLPIRADGDVVGSVHLYATSKAAFSGLHEKIAHTFHAWTAGAVTDSDLSFRTRRVAEQAPARLRERFRTDFALGYISASQRVTVEEAGVLLRNAARASGVTNEAIAAAFRRERPHHSE